MNDIHKEYFLKYLEKVCQNNPSSTIMRKELLDTNPIMNMVATKMFIYGIAYLIEKNMQMQFIEISKEAKIPMYKYGEIAVIWACRFAKNPLFLASVSSLNALGTKEDQEGFLLLCDQAFNAGMEYAWKENEKNILN